MKLTRHQQAHLRWRRSAQARGRAGFWITLAINVALFVASQLLKPKPQIENAKPAGLGDFDLPTATEGRAVPLAWGTVRISGPNVTWHGDLRQEAITQRVQRNIFSSSRQTIGFQYKIGIQFSICRGPVDELLGIWIGDDQVWEGSVTDQGTLTIDEPELFGGQDLGQGGFLGTFRFNAGGLNQVADPYISQFQQQGGDTPGYRGTCTVNPASEPFYVGNSTSLKPYKFEIRRTPNQLGVGLGREVVNDGDANPACVLYEILTDIPWGLGYNASQIDTTSFQAAAGVLFSENNGFSMVLDTEREASEVIRLIEEQIDGIVEFDELTAKWQLKLVRDDYVLLDLPLVDESNSKLTNYSRGSWSNTTNAVRVPFVDRSDNYKDTYALAQDTANVRIQNGVNISSTRSYPGVKDGNLANSLAWRDLRTLSYPLAKAKVRVQRSFWRTKPGDVLRFSHAYLGIENLAMRVQSVDYGNLEDGEISLSLVQDVFYTATPSFADPTATDWGDPFGVLEDFAAADRLVLPAPRAIVRRDPDTAGALLNKLFVAARRSQPAASYEILQRNAASNPGGSFVLDGENFGFMRVGQLANALPAGSDYPLGSIEVAPGPNTRDQLLETIAIVASEDELGTDLTNLVVVGDEFMLVGSASPNGSNLDLDSVYRGALDTGQQDHAAGTPVYVVSFGAGLNGTDIPGSNEVDVKLLPKNLGGKLAEASATETTVFMQNRILAPYPPSLVSIEGTDWLATASLETQGTGPEDFGVDIEWLRRDFRIADSPETDSELAQLGTDAADIRPSFPATDTHTTDLQIVYDPAGTPTSGPDQTELAGNTLLLRRLDILRASNGQVPTQPVQLRLGGRHVLDGTTYQSISRLEFSFTATTALSGDFAFGLLGNSIGSAAYTTTTLGQLTFTLSSAFTGGTVQYRLNGGTWTTVINAGGTTGSTPLLTAGTTVEVRHTSFDTDLLKQLTMTAAGAGQNGFAVLEN